MEQIFSTHLTFNSIGIPERLCQKDTEDECEQIFAAYVRVMHEREEPKVQAAASPEKGHMEA